MEVFHTQLTVLLYLLLGNMLFGSLPLLLVKIVGYFSCADEAWNRKSKWSTFLVLIGAGIFISDSFLVLLPKANQEFTDAKKDNHNSTEIYLFSNPSEADSGHHHDSFPIAEFIVLWGFFLAYIFQEAVHFLCSKFNNRMSSEIRDMRVRFCSCAKRHTECSRTFKDARPDQTLFGRRKKLMESDDAPNPPGATPHVPLEMAEDPNAELLRSSILDRAMPNYGTVTNVTEPPVDNPLPALTAPVLLAAQERLIMAQQIETHQRHKFLISSMLMMLTLTLQYIFLGIHLGLHTKDSQQWQYLLVICLQNSLLTFSAGSYLAAGDLELPWVALLIGLLSTVSPVGMIAAMVEANSLQQIPHLAKGTVSAFACGTLMYTTFYEMLRHKHYGSVVGLSKFLAIIIGAGVMTALQYASLTLRYREKHLQES